MIVTEALALTRRHAKPKVTDRSSISCALIAVLVAVFWLLPVAWAQSSGEDVHVTPRVEHTQAESGQPVDDPALETHTKPLKVDVNLVLVPVSIVDPENRQVTGLDKENFEVFEGKERQQIQHFSREDAPVSLGAIFHVSGSMASKIERARECCACLANRTMDETTRHCGRSLLQPICGSDFNTPSSGHWDTRVAIPTRGPETEGDPITAPGIGVRLKRHDLAGLVGQFSCEATGSSFADLPLGA